MNDGNENVWADLEGFELAAETDKALLFSYIDRDERHWIPKSLVGVIEYADGGDSEEYRIDEAVRSVQMPRWKAEELGLEIRE